MKRITNNQVREFYIDKEAKPRVTSEYMKSKYGQTSGGYVDFAKVCASKGEYIKENNSENEQQRENYYILQKCLESKDYETYDISYLNRIDDICILDVNFEDECEPNQKWHLYVSLFAQSIVENNTFRWDNIFRKYPCLQLRLWMAEVAGIDVKNIENAIRNNAGKKEVNDLIKAISWDEIFAKVYDATKKN